MLYISHRLEEVKAIADGVTVLRDGKRVATRPAVELQPLDMAQLMVGRDLLALYPERAPRAERRAGLRGRRLSRRPAFARGCRLRRCGAGEILGFAGLVGAGRTELFEGAVRPARRDRARSGSTAPRSAGATRATPCAPASSI